ncbi:MAG TPA: lipopolysaccharide biosynthesis protein [Bacteroidales bacterium]|nr:lipopolysaccharide biosynthesis protein [Bacteroidales bacterium]
MEKTLKQKTTTALVWSFIDKFGQQILYFATGVIFGRKLINSDYGLVASLTFFTAVSVAIIGSGYGRALVNQKKATQDELQTVFLYNVGMSLFFYVVLFFAAPLIAKFFGNQDLIVLSRVLFLSIPLNAFFVIQEIVLNMRMDLNGNAKANIYALIPTSLLAGAAALLGFGVWALVIQAVALAIFKLVFYWRYGGFRPGGTFRKKVLKDLFPFGSRVMLTNLINAGFSNIYSVLIGRFYSMAQLGFFSFASKYQDIPSGLISNTFRGVSVPLLSQLNEEDDRLKRVLGKLIRTVAFVGFPVMLGMVLIAKPFIIFLVTEKWLGAIPIFQILCFSGILVSFNSVLQEAVLAKGHSKAVLWVEILKKMVLVGFILLTINKGVIGLAIGLVLSSLSAMILSLLLSGKMVGYTIWHMIKDCAPYVAISAILCLVAYYLTLSIESNFLKFGSCILFVGSLYFIISWFLKLEPMLELTAWIRKIINLKKITNNTFSV